MLITGKHTELVLTRGVGLHTILGLTIDIAVGNCVDKAAAKFKHEQYQKTLKDKSKA